MKKTFILASLLIFGLLSCETDNRNEYENDSSNNQENTDTEEHDEVIVDDYDYESVIYPQGAIEGVFSVSKTKKVAFSQGNLQYQASSNTWRFAEHQYDMVGIGYGQTYIDYDEVLSNVVGGNVQDSDNREISSSYEGWIDLFGWGTGDNPTNTSAENEDYPTFVDWGVNEISNGENEGISWFTLSRYEWYYLLDYRLNASEKLGVAMVNGINGLVLLPDNWTLPTGAEFTSGFANYWTYEYYKIVNTYTISEWQVMENAGAVFLPAAGFRDGLEVWFVGEKGYYWSSTKYSELTSYSVLFDPNYVYPRYAYLRCTGMSVRLCSEIK